MTPVPPPRLRVLLRPESPTAVVFRQGPSHVFCTLGWDLRTDTFSVGQWCRHKIYVERCDISPDGRWLVYFALNGQWSSETGGAWTALAIAPYLRAVRLWPQGHTWGGGGAFWSQAEHPAPPNVMWATANVWLESSTLPPRKLVRDGWQATAKTSPSKVVSPRWVLRKMVGRTERHALHRDDGTVIDLPTWEWADFDAPRERILWAEAGKLFAAPITDAGLAPARELLDTTAMTFEALAAPYDAETIIVTG